MFPAANHSLAIAAGLGAFGVFLGSFGAHLLPVVLNARGLPDAELADLLDIFETGVRYQMYHALAMLGAGLLRLHQDNRWASASALTFLVGIVVFSGFLYAIALTGLRIFGAIVPLGGIALIVGWILLAVACFRFVRR